MNKTISLTMIVKNEERVLRRCLQSVVNHVDEIIVVDTGSTDSTKEIAKEFGAKVYDYEWNNNFASARNFALEQASCDWCLVLDADEYMSNDPSGAFQELMLSPNLVVGKVKIINKFQGKTGVEYEQNYITRFFPSSCRYSGAIHEQIATLYPRLRVNVEIKHDGYYQRNRSNRNIPLLLAMAQENPNDPYIFYQIAKEYRGLEQHEETFNYLHQAYDLITRQEGYAPSFIVNYIYAMMASGKLEYGIDVINNEQEFLCAYPDFFFVSALYLLELIISEPIKYEHLLPLIEGNYKKALEIGENGQEGSVRGTGSYAAHHNLGVYYEVIGNLTRAKEQYSAAAALSYAPSMDRLTALVSP
ncbi:glycosyltransferase [Paenibacillus polymyxa]